MRRTGITIIVSIVCFVCGAMMGCILADAAPGASAKVRSDGLTGYLSYLVPDSSRTKVLRKDDSMTVVTVDGHDKNYVTAYVAWDNGDTIVEISRLSPDGETASVNVMKKEWQFCRIGDLKRDGTRSFPAYITYVPESGEWKDGFVGDYDLNGTPEVKKKE